LVPEKPAGNFYFMWKLTKPIRGQRRW